ncbi:hypothetical protein [Rhodococcoides fascians]|uniref:hypothetical protein n=1 Tax=Rhodococcoides fascians TaxID=1828 RepID=UPI00050CBFCD|nr:hypothetical protein [Rhodococcus fascians]
MNPQEVADAEYRLVENAMAFLRRSVLGMSNADAHSDVTEETSFAVVDLAIAIEVLLKARLLRHDWKLLCTKKKLTEQQLSQTVLDGTAHTITPDAALNLLKTDVGLDLESDGHAASARQVGGLRNRAVHFTLTQGVRPIAVKASYGKGLHFVLWFLDREFRGNQVVDDLVEDVIEQLTDVVGRIDELVKARKGKIQDDLDAADVCMECPRCQQQTLMLTADHQVQCAFCLWKPADPTVAAEEYVENVLGVSHRTVKQGGEWPVSICVACSEKALIEGIEETYRRADPMDAFPCDGPVRPHWGCFGCGMTAGYQEIDRCTRCNEPTVEGGDGVSMCADCWGMVLESE